MSPTPLTGPERAPKSGVVKQLVIFLHGYGSNGDDLISLAPMLEAQLPDTQFVSPNAPFPIEMGGPGYQWFTLMDRNAASMKAGADTAAGPLNHYIDAQIGRFKLQDRNVALVGFSQGTMMALHAGLRRAQPLAGIVGFSGSLVDAEGLKANQTPVCLIHGEWDDVVPFAAMAMAEKSLKLAGISIETHARPNLPHSIDPQGLDTATHFLRKAFKLSL
jgi:phospholipase/carboxylesterase